MTDATATTSLQSADARPRPAGTSPGSAAAHAAGRPRQGDIAYVSLWVPDAERAAAFFSNVLGWQYADAAGGPGRARQITGLNVSHGILGGQPRSTLFLCFTVDDVDAALERVRAAGGTAEPATDEPYGRVASCTDDQGVQFAVYAAPPNQAGQPVAPIAGHAGDVAYLTLEVEDSARARAFYGSVVGWRFTPGRVHDGWNVTDVAPMAGLSGGHSQATVIPMYQVDDIEAAVERVQDAGGTASEVSREPYGLMSQCVDDQGTRFYLGQF